MSIARSSENDFLIAEYTLGVLDGAEASRATELLASDPDGPATALKWEHLFLCLTDELEPVAPPAQVLHRIQATLGHDITLVKQPSKWPGRLKRIWRCTLGSIWVWRAISVALAITAFVYAARPNLAVIDAPPPTHVAILQAPGQTSTPGWILTLDAHDNLEMKPEVHIDVPGNASVELWTHTSENRTPRSLGMVPANRATMIPAKTLGDVQPGQFFEMTLEQAGGSPSGSPSGPILFLGRMVVLQTKVPSGTPSSAGASIPAPSGASASGATQ